MGEIEKINTDDVVNIVLSYNDPLLLTNVFTQLGWTITQEIIETHFIAKQTKNLAAKLAAIKYLHKLLQDAAESAGMLGSVSRTVSGLDGSQTTFHAKRVALALNPERKKITSIQKEIVDGHTKQTTDGDVGSVGSKGGGIAGAESGRVGGTSTCGSEGGTDDDESGRTPDPLIYEAPPKEGDTDDPCIQHRLPTCDPALYPGVSSAEGDSLNTSDEE